VQGAGADQVEEITPQPRWVQIALDVPQGQTRVRFSCDAPCDPSMARRHFAVLDHRVTPIRKGELDAVVRKP
jgi:hypothetical protein